jgi:predicted nucleic acid-binding protein
VRGLTLDSGALIAYERQVREVVAQLKEALAAGRRVTIPTVVVVETWRGGSRSARLAPLLEACVLEPLGNTLARRAGELIASVKGTGAIDAVVVESAATRDDVIMTSDPEDLSRLVDRVTSVDLIVI